MRGSRTSRYAEYERLGFKLRHLKFAAIVQYIWFQESLNMWCDPAMQHNPTVCAQTA